MKTAIEGGAGGLSVSTSATGDSSVDTATGDGGSGVPTGAGGYKLEKEGRFGGNCDAPLFTSVEGLGVPLTPPREHGCEKFIREN